MRRRLVAAAGVVAVVTAALGFGMSFAHAAARQAEIGLDSDKRATVQAEARAFWDNPFERLLYVDFAVTEQVRTPHRGTRYVVRAVTLFGMTASGLTTDDCGTTRLYP